MKHFKVYADDATILFFNHHAKYIILVAEDGNTKTALLDEPKGTPWRGTDA